jgi:hypothetical protein
VIRIRLPIDTLQVGPRGQPSHHSGPARLARSHAVKDLHLLFSRQLAWRTLLRVMTNRSGGAPPAAVEPLLAEILGVRMRFWRLAQRAP